MHGTGVVHRTCTSVNERQCYQGPPCILAHNKKVSINAINSGFNLQDHNKIFLIGCNSAGCLEFFWQRELDAH